MTLAPHNVVAVTPGILQADVTDGLVLLDPTRVRAHALNRSAAIIWDLIAAQEHVDVASLTATINALSGVGDEPAFAAVSTVVEQLTIEGVVRLDRESGAEMPEPSTPAQFANVPFTDELAPASLDEVAWRFSSPVHRGIDVTFRFSCNDRSLGEYLAQVLHPLRTRFAAASHDYRIVASHDDPSLAGLVVLDGHVVARGGTGSNLSALVLWHMNQLVSTESSNHWLLHASAASAITDGADQSAAIVFPASMNSGKSTLVAGLVRAGYPYITDETVAIDPATLEVTPYPKSIGLDPGSWPLLPEFEPVVDATQQAHDHGKWYADPAALGFATPRLGRLPLGAVVFPSYAPHMPTSLERLDPLSASVELAQNSFNLVALGQTAVDAIAEVANTRPCYRLSVADLPSAVHALAPLFAASGTPHK